MKTTKIAFLLFLIIGVSAVFLPAQNIGIIGDSAINQCETKTYTIGIQNDSGNPLTNLVITAKLGNLTGFSYVAGTTSIDVNGGAAFCTAEPTISGTDLIWDIDVQCAGPFTLNDGDTLNVTFNLATDCNAVSGSLNVRVDYEISGTPTFDDTGAHSIQVQPGGVTIKKTPNVIPQQLWQNVTWTLTIENTGFGVIENVAVTDVLGAGLSYVSSSPAGSNSGQTTTWGAAEIPGFASMNPGEKITIDITATVIACENLDNHADARWGCDLITPCYDTATTIPVSTATASVQRIVKTPLIQYTPPDISFNYCDDYADVAFTITNIGDGRAHDVWLNVDFGALTVSDVSSGAIYNNANKRFELANPLEASPGPGNTYDLSFRLNYNTWCGGTFPSGGLLWQNVYKDDCDNEFYPPVELSTINTPANSSSLSVSKTGAPAILQIGAQVTYNITSAYSGPLSCGSGSVGEITVVDTVPDGFTVVDAGGGMWVPGGGGTGGTITWTYTPPASLNTSITLQVPDRTQCETYCFTTFTNSISATVVDCCGCTLNASASQTTAIECEELVDSDKTAVPAVGIRCSNIQYTNTYTFYDNAALDAIDLSQLVFQENAENEQEYVPGSLQVTLSGVGDITACALAGLTDTTPGAGGNLAIDFANCNTYGSVRSRTLTVAYRLRISESTVSACGGAAFYSWSLLDLNLTTGSECLPDGIIDEATTVAVDPPAMSLSITGLGQIVHKCQTQNITLTLTQTSGTANPRDVRLVLSGLNYYVVDPAATVCSGAVPPTSCTPAMVGDDYVWYFADGFNGSGQQAVIQLTVQKRCTGSGDLSAVAYFDDNCNDDANYDDTCSVTATETPALLLSGDLLIEKNPEVYYAATNTVAWKIYITNRGSGSAYNVWLDDVLGAGLDYSSAVVDNMTGVTVTADQDHNGGSINGCTIAISEMTAGQRREITFQALLIDCNNLTNDISTSWGCGGLDCQTTVSDSSTVAIPRPLLISTNVVTTPADACSSPSGMITLKNAGQTTCYNLQITETLPAGLTYVSGTTRWRVNGGGWNGPNVAYDPSPTTSPWQWTSTQISGLATANPGDTIEIEYDLAAECPFTGGNVTVATAYENPCGQVFNTADSVFTVAFRAPQITVVKTRIDEPIPCGDAVEWTITVTNTSGYTLPIIWVEDTMDAAFTYTSSVGDPPFTADNGTFDGVNKVSWELRNVNHNDTVTLILRADTDTFPCSPDLDNTVRAWWGCGAADGSSATKPGEDPPDNNLCLATTSSSTVRTETREPSISFLDIALNPTQIDACDDSTELTVTIQNTGSTDASNVDLVVTLPAGITYNANTSKITCGGVLTDPAPEPVISGNQLIYYNISNTASNLCNLVQASGGNDTITLVFSVRSNCYVTANVGFRLYYYDCCGDTQYNTTTSETLTALFPNLSITKTPQNSQVDCGDNQTWTITVTNNGTGNAQVVRIEDTLGDWIDYVSSSPAATAIGGQVYGWEINNLAGGTSASFDITGQLNPDAPQDSCSALLRQDNARAVWGCGVAGDAVDGDPTTTGYDCTYTSWANAAAATLAMPDLVGTAITPAISCTADGTLSGSISVTVRNQGDGIAYGGFQVQVTDGAGWTGTGSYGSDLAAGAETTITIDVTSWNPDCSPCTYNFTAAVDSGDAVCECREDNNDFGPQAYTPAIPDIEVDSDALAITCAADGQYRVSGTVTLRNAGCAGTLTQNVPMRFTLFSGAGCGGAQLAQWAETFSGVNIAAGSTQTFTITDYTITGNACTSASGCQFSILMEADYTDVICECDGTDNTRCSDKTFTIPDLRVVSDTLAISCSADGQIRIQGNLVVANDGCGANLVTNIPIRIRVYNNNAACAGTNGNLVFTQAGVNIPAGGTQTFAINRTINRNLCTNSTGCQVALGVELDYSNAICECSNANNNYCSPNKTVSIPDLQVTGDTLGISCLQDGQVRVSGTATIANTGCNAAVVGNMPVRFTLFSNINCGGAQLAQWTETFAGANITAGGSQVFTITNRDIITNICTNSTGCQVSMRIEADPAPSTICECNGGNNTRCSNKTVNVPDLRITAVTPSITCSGDGNLSGSVQVTVNNNGCGAASNIPVRLTSNCGYTFTDQTMANLGAGASTTLTFSFTPDISRCICIFTAAADPDNVICECDGTNNSLASAASGSAVPDLTISDIDFSGITCAGDDISGSVTVTVNNQGCGTANNFPVSLTTDGCLSFTDQTVVTLVGGASTTLTFNITGSWADCLDGACQFTAAADTTGAVCEYDGNNNTYSEIYNSTLPDLVVSDIDFSGISCTNDNISGSVAVTINNQGFSNAANFQVSLATDGCLSFTNQTVANLAAGASTTVTFNVSGSWANCSDCDCLFTAVVDATNTVCECDGDNNSRAETYNFTLPDLTINSITPSTNCVSDGNLQGTVVVNVSNTGCGAANGVVVRLSSDCGAVFSDQTINLAAGASTDVTFTYTPVCTACTCTFTAAIDPDNNVCECSGSNNTLVSAPFTTTVPDIEVQTDTLGISCAGDGQVSVSGTVTLGNQGCGANLTADIPVRFTLYDNTGCAGNILSQWTETFTAVDIASSGGSQAFTITPHTLTGDLCHDSTGCLVSIRIEADYNDSVCECDGTDNSYCADNKAVDIPDLAVASDTLGVSCAADGQVTISGTVTLGNQGCGSNLTADIPTRFTLYDNENCTGNVLLQWTETFTGVNIPAGGGNQAFTIIPQSLTGNLVTSSGNCRISIGVEVDYNDTICECNNANNTYCGDSSDSKMIDIPDLEVPAENLDLTCLSDGQARISGTFTMANNGCGSNLTADIPVRFTLFNNPGCVGDTLAQWTETFSGVNIPAGGGTQVFTITAYDMIADLCANSAGCRLSLRIEADYPDTICESDGSDNSLCSLETVTLPNLAVTAAATSVTCVSDGSVLGTNVTVTNTGCAAAAGVVVRLTSDCGLTFPDQVIDLAAGETRVLLFTFTSGITNCNCNFTATIDPDNAICECNGADNTMTSTQSMLIPDLEIQNEALTIACADDGVIRASGTITLVNNGCGPNLTENVNMRFSLYDNTGCTGNLVNQWTETFSSVSIASAGGTQTFTIQAHDITTDFCANSTDCQVSLRIEADYNDMICEWDGTDNTLCVDKTSDCLDVMAVSLTPATVCRGDGKITGNFTLTVRNSGGNPLTQDFSIRVEDGAGWSTELRYNADLGGPLPLAAGAEAILTIDWNPNFNINSCVFNNISVLVDAQDEICQCTTANDTLTGNYRLPYPNIKPTAITANCSADGVYLVQVTVENDGCSAVGECSLRLKDNHGNTKDTYFSGLNPGESITVDFIDWPALCAANSVSFTAEVDADNKICEMDGGDQILEYLFPGALPDIVMGNIEQRCNPDGSITFTMTVTNAGGAAANNIAVAVYDGAGNAIFNQMIDLAPGASQQLTFTTAPLPKNTNHTFRFVVDENRQICECNGNNNEKSITVNCPGGEGEPPLVIEKICPPGQAPGGLFRFEIRIENTGAIDLLNVTIEDLLPPGFQYVLGSSTLDGASTADPQISNPDPQTGSSLVWQIGTLKPGQKSTLFFSAVADADIDPGRYCNEAGASANAAGSTVTIQSKRVQCCTVVSREAGAGCCLNVEEWPTGAYYIPEGPLSFIEPYFHTESAMFAVYAIFNLWQNADLTPDALPLFMKERLRNYARSTIEEFYLDSRSGITLPDGSLRLSFAGAYPEQDETAKESGVWVRKLVDETMTAAQMGFELLALNETLKAGTDNDMRQKLERLIKERLDFLAGYMDDLPHAWEIKDKPDKPSELQSIKKLDEKAHLYDRAALYLAMVELAGSGNSAANDFAAKLRSMLTEIDNKGFAPDKVREEFFFMLALLKQQETDLAKAKTEEFESLYRKGASAADADKDKNAGKDMLSELRDYALAAAVDYKAGGSLYTELMNRVKEKYYLPDSGVFADKQPDFTFKMTLESLAALILSFDTKEADQREHNATALYRTFDEVGMFLKKRNLVIGKPLYSLLKNYPFAEPLLPVLSLTKAKRSIAPVFSRDALVHSTQLRPTGEILIPQDFSKILSPQYETDTSRIAAISYGLQYFGRELLQNNERAVKEEGRSLIETGKKYLDSILQAGAGVQQAGNTVLPYDTLAVKGPIRAEYNLESLNSGVRFSTKTLADYLMAEKAYLDDSGPGIEPGKFAAQVPGLMVFQARIIERFKDHGYVPMAFDLFIENGTAASTGPNASAAELDFKLIPSKEQAEKITIARLYHALASEKSADFLAQQLKSRTAKTKLTADDLVFLAAVPQLAAYFKEEIKELVDMKDSKISLNCADIIGRRLMGAAQGKESEKSLQNLIDNWDKEAVLPKSDRVENIERGLIYHHEPRGLLLYLFTAYNNDSLVFQFKRTLNFFTYLLENEWGIEKENAQMSLPSREYLLFREETRKNIEPGDLVNFRVRVTNTCPEGFGSAWDIADLYLRSRFSPALIHTGTQPIDGLFTLGDFQWRYEGFPEGSLLEYMYQAYVPRDFRYAYIDGSIYAGGRQGYQDFGPTTASGDNCADIDQVGRIQFEPLAEIHGLVYEDRNVDGVKDVNEPGAADILIKDTRGRVLRSDAEGRFIVLAGDSYEGVQVELKSVPSNYLINGSPTQLVNRNFVGDIYFALIPCWTATGFVYSDTNGNGVYDDGEALVAGVTLTAKDKQAITGQDGRFIFRNLPIMWQSWIKISDTQLFYKGAPQQLKIKIDE